VGSSRISFYLSGTYASPISAVADKTTFLGTGMEAGADEDDFHAFKRGSAKVDKEQKTAERIQKARLKDPSKPQKEKKVISF
jgi:hypothetical protein